MVRTRTAAPYTPGDYVQALHNDAARGTCLITAVVKDVGPSADRERPWTITYDVKGTDRTVNVDARGRDRNDYVQRATHTLDWATALSEAGNQAIELAKAVRRRGVRGALATTTGGNCIAVVVTWPSGADRIIADVNVDPDGHPTFNIGAYEDDQAADLPGHEHTAHSLDEAADEIARIFRIG